MFDREGFYLYIVHINECLYIFCNIRVSYISDMLQCVCYLWFLAKKKGCIKSSFIKTLLLAAASGRHCYTHYCCFNYLKDANKGHTSWFDAARIVLNTILTCAHEWWGWQLETIFRIWLSFSLYCSPLPSLFSFPLLKLSTKPTSPDRFGCRSLMQ